EARGGAAHGAQPLPAGSRRPVSVPDHGRGGTRLRRRRGRIRTALPAGSRAGRGILRRPPRGRAGAGASARRGAAGRSRNPGQGGCDMSLTVCLAPADTVGYPQGAGHLWVYLQWALALRMVGFRVIWLEGIDLDGGDCSAGRPRRWRNGDVRQRVATLGARLAAFGFADTLALYSINGEPLPRDLADG